MGGTALCLSLLAWVLRARGLATAANLAQLISIPLTLLPLVIPLLRWWHHARRPTRVTAYDIAQLREELAPLVYDRWRTESRIRALDDPDPIPVQWRRTDDQRIIDAPGNLTSDVLTVASSADVAALIVDFRQLRRSRLVILGGAGAGKTTLAVQILLELLRDRVDDRATPVPVLLSGASWDPERYRTLWDWVAYAIEQDYPELLGAGHRAQAVHDLAVQGHILPVIDGFDEATPEIRPRLLEAVHNAMDGNTQLIVTSRADEYLAAVEAYGRVLPSAVVIEPQPLSADAAADYIERCLPAEPGPSWRILLTRLRMADDLDKPASAIAEVASAPLGLWLLRVAYLTPRTDPAALLDDARFVEADALRAHLFDQLIAATVMTRPPSDNPADFFRPRSQYDPNDIERWLRFLAGNLDRWGTKDFDWARDAPALTAPAHPERIADRLTLIVTAVRAYVDVVLAQRPRLGIPLALLPLVPAAFACFIFGRLTAAVLGLFLGEGASNLLGAVVGIGAALGLIVAAMRLLAMAADYRQNAEMDWTESLLTDWANVREFLIHILPGLTFALTYALLVGVGTGIAIGVVAPDASVGWVVVSVAVTVGLLAMSGYQIDSFIPPGPGTTAPWYGISPVSGLRGSLLGALLFGLLGGVLIVTVGGQQSAFLAMTVLATAIACSFLVPLFVIVIPVLYGLTSLGVATVRYLRYATILEGAPGLWHATAVGHKLRLLRTVLLATLLSTTAAIGWRLLQAHPIGADLLRQGPTDWLGSHMHDFRMVWAGQLRYVAAVLLAWALTIPGRGRRTWKRWLAWLAIAGAVVTIWTRHGPSDPFRLILTGQFTGLNGKFTLQASGSLDAYVGTHTVNSSLNFADLLTPGDLRVTLGIWLALLPLALVVTLFSEIDMGQPRTWWTNKVVSLPHVLAGRLPGQLPAFLDDAHRLGLLRTVGTTVYQFRHADFQDHLARTADERDAAVRLTKEDLP